MRYSLAIFDMDGTILNTLEDLADSCNAVLKQHQFPSHTTDEVRLMVGNGIPKLIERAIPGGKNNPAFEAVLSDFITYYEAHSAIKTRPYAGIPQLLQKLRAAGITVAVNTNKLEEAAKILCDDYFPGLFDVVSGGRPGMPPKPAPDGIREILRRTGLDGVSDGQRAVFIGDSDVDVQTGLNAGLDVIGVEWGFRGRKFLLEHGAHRIAADCDELLAMLCAD